MPDQCYEELIFRGREIHLRLEDCVGSLKISRSLAVIVPSKAAD